NLMIWLRMTRLLIRNRGTVGAGYLTKTFVDDIKIGCRPNPKTRLHLAFQAFPDLVEPESREELYCNSGVGVADLQRRLERERTLRRRRHGRERRRFRMWGGWRR